MIGISALTITCKEMDTTPNWPYMGMKLALFLIQAFVLLSPLSYKKKEVESSLLIMIVIVGFYKNTN